MKIKVESIAVLVLMLCSCTGVIRNKNENERLGRSVNAQYEFCVDICYLLSSLEEQLASGENFTADYRGVRYEFVKFINTSTGKNEYYIKSKKIFGYLNLEYKENKIISIKFVEGIFQMRPTGRSFEIRFDTQVNVQANQ